ncbi:MAG TPA: hypothetical protein VGM23_03275 [Armatimonadota bacterium]|jgi:hypothetical protein
MINRAVRDQAAEVIQQFSAGEFSYDAITQRYPRCKDDLAVQRIYHAIGMLKEERRRWWLLAFRPLTDEDRQALDRFALFLDTDREYEWPPYGFLNTWGVLPVYLSLVGLMLADSLFDLSTLLFFVGFAIVILYAVILQLVTRPLRKRFAATGDIDVWPFLRQTDYEEAKDGEIVGWERKS